MKLCIESVFLLGCALFIIYYARGCGHTNVEGFFECGSCPFSTAQCPRECPAKQTDKCGLLGLTGKGAKYQCECFDDNYAGGKPVCLDTGSEINLDIGKLDLWVDWVRWGRVGMAYTKEMEDPNDPNYYKWVEEESFPKNVDKHGHFSTNTEKNIVTDNDKLQLLSKLSGDPYYIENIGIKTLEGGRGWQIGVKTWKNVKGKHFYFSDRTGDAYCLSVTPLGGGDDGSITDKRFTHSMEILDAYNSETWPAHIQYLGHKESKVPFC